MIMVLVLLIPVYILWFFIRKFLLSCGMILCLLPDGLRQSGVSSGIRGAAAGYIVLAALLPTGFLYLIGTSMSWMSSSGGIMALIFLPTAFLLLTIMPSVIAEGMVKTVIKKRRTGEWS